MKLSTIVEIPYFPFRIEIDDPIVLTGSCFSENIGRLLSESKFQVINNPFGILYNPISISQSIRNICDKKEYNAAELFHANGLYSSFDHHGEFSSISEKETLLNINNSILSASEALKKAKCIVITLGTSFVYEEIKSKRIVANCHKLPDSMFTRFMLMPKKIIDEMEPTLIKLKQYNPGIEVMMTVSPVRHFRDGMIGNQRSKASLILAVQELVQQHEFVHYFPSYELVIDEMRDYRFYTEDLVHPNSTAIKLIWNKFSEHLISERSMEVVKQVSSIIRASKHRPFNTNSKEHQKFIHEQLKRIDALESEHPKLNFDKEKDVFRSQLED